MLIYKNQIPSEYIEILQGQKIPYYEKQFDCDILGLHGDNLQGLIALLDEYKNSIKLIYSDVPYNTGNQNFIYNDEFISEDSLNYHSSWISYMIPRIKLSRELLSEDGAMVISIDEHERRNLENICVEIFGEQNVLSQVTVVSNKGGGGRRNKKDLVTTNEYLIICAKNLDSLKFGEGVLNDNVTKKTKPRSVVAYNQKFIYNRVSQFFPFLVEKNSREVTTITTEEYENLLEKVKRATQEYRGNKKNAKRYDDGLHKEVESLIEPIIKKYSETHDIIFPVYDGKWGRWVPTHKTILEKKGVYATLYEQKGQIYYIETIKDFVPMKTIMDDPKYSNSNATKALKEIYGDKNFDTPKSPILMRDIITSFSDDGDIILDWCAGSNSTFHGLFLADTLQGYNRKYIYIQRDENGIKIFEENAKSRVDILIKKENSEKKHITRTIILEQVDDFYLSENNNENTEDYIIEVENFNNWYNNFTKKFEKLYQLV